jgi:hypothetical protein
MASLKDQVQAEVQRRERMLSTSPNAWDRQRVEGEVDAFRTVIKMIDLGGGANEKSKGGSESNR